MSTKAAVVNVVSFLLLIFTVLMVVTDPTWYTVTLVVGVVLLFLWMKKWFPFSWR